MESTTDEKAKVIMELEAILAATEAERDALIAELARVSELGRRETERADAAERRADELRPAKPLP